MSLMTYFFLALFWLFCGSLAAHLAKQRGRNPRLWFSLGVVLGLVGVFLAFFAPKKVEVQPSSPPPAPIPQNLALDIPWFYLENIATGSTDPTGTTPIGPIFFSQLNTLWEQNRLTENSYVWNPQMEGWKKIHSLPELCKEWGILYSNNLK